MKELDLPLHPCYSATSLLTESVKPKEWFVPGIIPRGFMLMICAVPKTGKTILVRDLCLALLTGQPWLGKPVNEIERILYVDEENSLGTIQDYMHDLCAGRGITADQLGERFVTSHFALTRIAERDRFKVLAECVEVFEPNLVVVDNFLRICPAIANIQNDSAVMAKVLTDLRLAVMEVSNATVLTIHHLPKDETRQGMPMGATGIAASVDAWWILKRKHGGDRKDRARTLTPIPGRILAGTEQTCTISAQKHDGYFHLSGTWEDD